MLPFHLHQAQSVTSLAFNSKIGSAGSSWHASSLRLNGTSSVCGGWGKLYLEKLLVFSVGHPVKH